MNPIKNKHIKKALAVLRPTGLFFMTVEIGIFDSVISTFFSGFEIIR
ncbi:Uncharacterised protein [uncultured Eubacterium sp.]|nr:Uncharacterised protein [uncultured Eubacterium sp.]